MKAATSPARLKRHVIASFVVFLGGVAGLVTDEFASVDGPLLWIISAALIVQMPVVIMSIKAKLDQRDRETASRIVREYNAGVDRRERGGS